LRTYGWGKASEVDLGAAEGPSEAIGVPKKVSPETFSRTEVGALSEPRIIAASSAVWRQAYNGPLFDENG
jgi:hypothetical protein